MAFEELSENLKEQLLITKSRIEESRFVNSFNERFSSLSKRMQTTIISLACIFLCLIVLIYPISQYKSSLGYEAEFEERKELTQKIISYSKNRASQSKDPKKYGLFDFKNEVSSIGRNVRLLDTQLSIMPGSGKKSPQLPKGAEEMKFKIMGKQFNLTQAITTAYGVKNLSDSLFLENVTIKAHPGDTPPGNYFDVEYVVSNFYVKPESELMPKAKIKPTKKKNNRRGK